MAGTFAVVDNTSPRSLRIDVRVHRGDGDPIAVGGIGHEAELFTLVAEAGQGLNGHLGLNESSPETTGAARAAYPRSLDAFAQGELERARQSWKRGSRSPARRGSKSRRRSCSFSSGRLRSREATLRRPEATTKRSLALRHEIDEARTIAESETALAALDLEEGRAVEAERRAREVLKSLGSSPAGILPASLQLLIAWALLVRRDLPDSVNSNLLLPNKDDAGSKVSRRIRRRV